MQLEPILPFEVTNKFLQQKFYANYKNPYLYKRIFMNITELPFEKTRNFVHYR